MKIIITGAAGNLGNLLAEYLEYKDNILFSTYAFILNIYKSNFFNFFN
jgi:dTDP-4-dehydrorhamnose reductase